MTDTKMSADEVKKKIAAEIVKALIADYLADFEQSFDDLCEEAGIDPEEVEELRP
jgi:hypothetical protein